MKSPPSSKRVLFTAEWRELVLLNFEIDPKILLPRVPPGTELDFYNENTFVSLVGRICLNAQVYGIPVTLLKQFEEVHLRFYVKRQMEDEVRRGVCLIRNIVPTRAAAMLLGWLFRENFDRMQMRHQSSGFDIADPGSLPDAEYRWKVGEDWNRVRVKARSRRRGMKTESKEQFILDHHHAYIGRGDKTLEYFVSRPPWLIWDAASGNFDCDVEGLFGKEFRRPLNHRPASVFLARGSEINIHRPTVITA